MGTAVESGSREITDLRDSRVLALVLVCTVSFMNVLDITVVSVALSDIGQSLGASQSELQWVVDAYTLPLGALLKSGAAAIVPMGAGPVHGGVGRVRVGLFDGRTQRFPGSSGGRWGDLLGRRCADDL